MCAQLTIILDLLQLVGILGVFLEEPHPGLDKI